MTNAPADLLALRSRIQARTGLSAVEVGIVGNSAHAATGGYHEGRTDLANAGVLHTDYSVHLPRDVAGLTESASAMDIGASWASGRAAWLRFNALLVAALHGGDPALATVRATNYSPDGTRRLRTDRETGWSVVTSTDSVDVHTHLEWYRDTEAKRQPSLDRIDVLIAQAINPAVQLAARGEVMGAFININYPGGNKTGWVDGLGGFRWVEKLDALAKAQEALGTAIVQVNTDQARRAFGVPIDDAGNLTPPAAPVALTDDQVDRLAAQVVAGIPVEHELTDAEVVAAVRAGLEGATIRAAA